MKSKICALAIVLFFLPLTQEQKPAGKKVAEYQAQISRLQDWVTNLQDDEFYEKTYKFKDNKTGKEQKFAELPEYTRVMFQLITTQDLNGHMKKLAAIFKEDLKKVAKYPESKGVGTAVAGPDDLKTAIGLLHKLRQEAVESWQAQAEAAFEAYPKAFQAKEKALYLKGIKSLKDSLK